ncbi:MAG: metallophosphoesterase [Promethearchaeota archaeon]
MSKKNKLSLDVFYKKKKINRLIVFRRFSIIKVIVMFWIVGILPILFFISINSSSLGNYAFYIPLYSNLNIANCCNFNAPNSNSQYSVVANFNNMPDASHWKLPTDPSFKDEFSFGNGGDINLPSRGFLNSSDYKIFWWLHISDTQNCWAESEYLEYIKYFFNITVPLINPLFTINTGDLVDSDYSKFFSRVSGQRLWEWQLYNQTLRENGVNHTNYFDILGNHDVYGDEYYEYYLNYSISGSFFKTDQFVVNVRFSWGNYTFYFLSAPDDYGLEFPFVMGGFMGRHELSWLENKLDKYPTSNLTFAFGHQPIHQIFSGLSPSGKMLIPLLTSKGVDFHACGHEHKNSYQNVRGMACVETKQFHKDKGCYKIIAIDNDGISTSFQVGQKFPIGIITSPIDYHYSSGDYDENKLQNVDKVRALVWDPLGVNSVYWRSDENETWSSMTHIEGPLYQANFDQNLIDGKTHKIEVQINGNSGIKTESIIYRSVVMPFFGWNEMIPILIAAFIGLVFVLPITKFILRRKNPEKYGRKPGHELDMKQAKLVFIKFIILTICPYAFSLAFADSLSVVFTFFIIANVENHLTFIYADILLFIAATYYLVGILPVVLNLDRSIIKRGVIPWLFLSLIFEATFFIFYFNRYSIIGLIQPGNYLMIVLDILMIKNAFKVATVEKSRNIENN